MKKVLAASSILGLLLVSGCQYSPKTIEADVNKIKQNNVKTYSAESFFKTTAFGMARSGEYAFSPDGSKVLVSSDRSGVFNVYAMPVDGSKSTQLTTSEKNAAFGISYFPNDERILFSQDGGGDELNHVYVQNLDGSVTDLTPGEKLKAMFAGWSQDGAKFWVLSNERDPKNFDVYQYDTKSLERNLVFKNESGYQPSAISGDGKWLALTKSVSNADSNIYLVDLSSKQANPKLITEHQGDVQHGVYGFTADNKLLSFSTNEFGEFVQAWNYNLVTAKRSLLAKDDWDVSFVSNSPSGLYRVVGVNADARTKVTLLNTETGKKQPLGDLPAGNVGSIRFSNDEKQVGFTLSGDRFPTNIYTTGLANPAPLKLTDSMNPEINSDDLVDSEVVRYPSFDGLKIPSILYKPKNASTSNKVPALVFVHGGPGGQSRQGYSALFQHLVNNGYAVLAANNRGSSGYGKTFYHMDDKKHGDVDLKDIVYGRKYLESLDWVDGSKVGIIGGSYGGYMTAAALAFEPDAFDVGINIFGVTNWVRTLKSIPPWWESFRKSLYDELGDPAIEEERLTAISPLFHAKNITKPLLVVQGANDPRVLQVESDELVAAVRSNGVPVEYVLFPDEGHGFLRKENRITASKAYLKFLNEHLKKAN